MKKLLPALLKDQQGATVVEYGLIIALVVLGAMLGMDSFATAAIDLLESVASTASAAMSA